MHQRALSLEDFRSDFTITTPDDGPQHIVVGSVATDILYAQSGAAATAEHGAVYDDWHVRPGGRAANIARMMATIEGQHGYVAMVGRTGVDPTGLWRVPLEALRSVGVDVSFIRDNPLAELHAHRRPAVCFIEVAADGNAAYKFIAGASATLAPHHIDQASDLFTRAAANFGSVSVTCNPDLAVVAAVLRKGHEEGMPVYIDPGGLNVGDDFEQLYEHPIELLKPNRAEAEMLTGVRISSDGNGASDALDYFEERGVVNTLITLGAAGAVLRTDGRTVRIPAPAPPTGGAGDSTGCGDQTLAAYVIARQARDVEEAARAAIAVGTAQFGRVGADPVPRDEVLDIFAQYPTHGQKARLSDS